MKVLFVKWRDPGRVQRDDYPSDPDDHSLVDLLDACSDHPFKPAGAYLSPMGVIPAAPHSGKTSTCRLSHCRDLPKACLELQG